MDATSAIQGLPFLSCIPRQSPPAQSAGGCGAPLPVTPLSFVLCALPVLAAGGVTASHSWVLLVWLWQRYSQESEEYKRRALRSRNKKLRKTGEASREGYERVAPRSKWKGMQQQGGELGRAGSTWAS